MAHEDDLKDMEAQLQASKLAVEIRMSEHTRLMRQLMNSIDLGALVADEVREDLKAGLTGPIRFVVAASLGDNPSVKVGLPLKSGTRWGTSNVKDLESEWTARKMIRDAVRDDRVKKKVEDLEHVLAKTRVFRSVDIDVRDRACHLIGEKRMERFCNAVQPQIVPALAREMSSDRMKERRHKHAKTVAMRRVRDAAVRAVKARIFRDRNFERLSRIGLPPRTTFIAYVQAKVDCAKNNLTFANLSVAGKIPGLNWQEIKAFDAYCNLTGDGLDLTDEEIGSIWDKLVIKEVQEG